MILPTHEVPIVAVRAKGLRIVGTDRKQPIRLRDQPTILIGSVSWRLLERQAIQPLGRARASCAARCSVRRCSHPLATPATPTILAARPAQRVLTLVQCPPNDWPIPIEPPTVNAPGIVRLQKTVPTSVYIAAGPGLRVNRGLRVRHLGAARLHCAIGGGERVPWMIQAPVAPAPGLGRPLCGGNGHHPISRASGLAPDLRARYHRPVAGSCWWPGVLRITCPDLGTGRAAEAVAIAIGVTTAMARARGGRPRRHPGEGAQAA